MHFRMVPSYKRAGEARGVAVVIDVLRACTTICYAFAGGADIIIPVAKVEDAFLMKKIYPDALLIGEREGLKVTGCDFGNSPTDIQAANLTGKTVIMTTSAGTQGMVGAVNADEIITGAFVNAGAIVSYLQKKNPEEVSFIQTDDRWDDNEDATFAHYVVDRLEGKKPDFAAIYTHLYAHPGARHFTQEPMLPTSQTDFALSIKEDVFPFVVRLEKTSEQITLRKIENW